jgi:hypothetical protein
MSERHESGRLPDFLIAGETKCGSTTLWELLRRHPQVFLPARKEIHYFSSYSEHTEVGRLERDGLAPYRALFAGAGAAQRCGEATPSYLFDADACERIRDVLPHVRIVAILRDPAERTWSHYWHQVRQGRETLPFEAALEAEQRRISAGDVDARSHYSYLARGRYVESLDRYAQAFSREQLCVVLLEELRGDPRGALARLCAHLGIDPAALPDAPAPRANQASFRRWPALDRFVRRVRYHAHARGARLGHLADAVDRASEPLRARAGVPPLPDPLRASLRSLFAASDRELARFLGRALPWAPERAS